MRILITGSTGMLGQALLRTLIGHHLFTPRIEITNYYMVKDGLDWISPDLVIHCAAYTNVDKAETERDLAFLVNGFGTENLAIECSRHGVPLMYISTDYVFGGGKTKPYTTWDEPNPVNVYGESKLAGERAVLRHMKEFYIVRTSWLYGPGGSNFVDAVREAPKPVRVISSQWGSPTYSISLAEMISDLIKTKRWGLYHAADKGFVDRISFAEEIVGLDNVKPLIWSNRPAKRPDNSALDVSNLAAAIGRDPPNWKESLHSYLKTLS